MRVTFQPALLDAPGSDDEAMLVLRDGRLVAILVRLGDMHEEETGLWFVETVFGERPQLLYATFADPAEIVARIG